MVEAGVSAVVEVRKEIKEIGNDHSVDACKDGRRRARCKSFNLKRVTPRGYEISAATMQ